MTDNTPQKKAENSMNNSGITALKSDSETQSRPLPEAAELKARFKAGSIPLQTDFADVIDLANIGRQAVGGTEGQTGPAEGFTLSSMGRLELKPNKEKGIIVDKDGVAARVDENMGVHVSGSGIGVKLYPEKGLEHDTSGVRVNVNKDKGISVDKDGLMIICGNGIQVDDGGVSIKAGEGIQINERGVNVYVDASSGLMVSQNYGLKLKTGYGISTDQAGVKINIKSYKSGLSSDWNGLSVKPGKGISVSDEGVSLNFPIGFGVLSFGDKDPKGVFNGTWSDYGTIGNGQGTYKIWIRIR